MDAGEIALGESERRRNLEIGELRAQAIVKFFEFSGAANHNGAVVENAILSKELRDGVTIPFVPDFVEPADDELFVLIEGRNGLGGGHGSTSLWD